MGYGNDETNIKEPKIYFRGMKNYGKDICRMKKERIIAAAAAVTLMSGTISPGVFASNTESTRISDTSWSIPDSVAGKISYSNSYNPAKWQDYWSNGGYAGVTRVIVKGVNAEITVDNGPEPADDRTDVQASKGVPDETVINVSGSGAAGDDGYVFDYDPTVNITNADEVILITASDRDKEMGEYDGFKDAAGYDLVNNLSDRVNVAAEKYGGAEFDYGAALAPHAEKHCKEFGAVKLDLNL